MNTNWIAREELTLAYGTKEEVACRYNMATCAMEYRTNEKVIGSIPFNPKEENLAEFLDKEIKYLESLFTEKCPTCAQIVKSVFDHIDKDCEHS